MYFCFGGVDLGWDGCCVFLFWMGVVSFYGFGGIFWFFQFDDWVVFMVEVQDVDFVLMFNFYCWVIVLCCWIDDFVGVDLEWFELGVDVFVFCCGDGMFSVINFGVIVVLLFVYYEVFFFSVLFDGVFLFDFIVWFVLWVIFVCLQ